MQKRKKLILVTKDLELGSLVIYPKGSHYGLLILRLPYKFKTRQINKVLKQFLKDIEPNDLIGSIAILELGRYRIRNVK